MARSQEGACQHGVQCYGCNLWYCADDEMIECTQCGENHLCYACIKMMFRDENGKVSTN